MALGFSDEQLSPLYLEARQAFLAQLALSGADLNSLQSRTENDTVNELTINSFCQTLPGNENAGKVEPLVYIFSKVCLLDNQ